MNPSQALGPFFGFNLSPESCDIVAIQHIPAKLRAAEPELFQKKWFDYRRMHPTLATYMLVHEYCQQYARMISIIEDVTKSKYVRGMKGKDFLDSREKLSFWRLRQHIDRLGIRYDFFLREAMNHCIDTGWKQPPRPNHLYTNDDVTVAIMDAWERECRARMQYPKDDHFQVENFAGTPEQLACEAWLIDRIKRRPHQHYPLGAAMYSEGVLRIEAALEHFDTGTVQAAIDYCLTT